MPCGCAHRSIWRRRPVWFGEQTLTAALAQQRLDDEVSTALLEIPAGFAAASGAGDPIAIVYRSNEPLADPSLTFQAVQTAISRIGSTQTAVRVGEAVADDIGYLAFADAADRSGFLDSDQRPCAEALGRRADPGARDAARDRRRADGLGLWAVGAGHEQYVCTVCGAAHVGGVSSRAPKQWTIQRTLTMPVSRAQILGGKLLAYFVIGAIELTIIFTFGYLLGLRYVQRPAGADPDDVRLYPGGHRACADADDLYQDRDAGFEHQPAEVALTLAPLGGAWWPLDIVPGWMRVVGHVSPIAWAMDAYNALIFRDAGTQGGVVLPVLVLLGMAALFFAIGLARRFDFDQAQ